MNEKQQTEKSVFFSIKRQQMFHKFDKKLFESFVAVSQLLLLRLLLLLLMCRAVVASAFVITKQHSINVMRAHSFKR